MESSVEWQLKLIVWEFFCTLTWDSRSRGTISSRRRHVTRWLSEWAHRERPHLSKREALSSIAFVIRWERGELGGLPHCHIVVSRFPEPSINLSRCFRQKALWQKHGFARVRLYNPQSEGDLMGYMDKRRDTEGANAYELKKFPRADAVYISPGAWQEMLQARTVAKRMSPLTA